MRVVEYEPKIDMFTTDDQKSSSVEMIKTEFLRLLEVHIRELKTEIEMANDSVQNQLRSVASAKIVL